MPVFSCDKLQSAVTFQSFLQNCFLATIIPHFYTGAQYRTVLSFVEIHLPDFRLFLHFIKLILNFNQFSTVLAAPTSPPPTLAELSVIMYHTTAVTRRCACAF